MNKILIILIVVFVFTSNVFASEIDKELIVNQLVLKFLKSLHYSPHDFDDEFSQKAFDLYLERVDYGKRFLLKGDVDYLQKKYSDKIDDLFLNGSSIFYEEVMEIFNKRLSEIKEFYPKILENEFDFSIKENLETDYDKIEFVKTSEELYDYWRKILKYQVAYQYFDLVETDHEDNKVKKVEEVDENINYLVDENINPDLMKKAVEKIKKRTDRMIKRIEERDEEDSFSTYINSLTHTFDPHTSYMPPQRKEDFDIDMTGKLEGIGARLSEQNGKTKITEIIPGSPAWKQKQLEPEDVIFRVAQGEDEPVDIDEMPLREVVKLIRGKKGTEVRLTVRKPSNEVIIVPIIRDVVVIEETYAKAALIEDKEIEKKVGYIQLPKFYRDFKNAKGRNSTNDIRDALISMRDDNPDGIILDLRNNSGGALTDAVNIAGLFINEGPVVQVRDSRDKKMVHSDTDPEIYYEGPLVVLVNSFSASASEILAGALQDYNRAVIVGSDHTFGKGTVQNLMDLDRFLNPKFKEFKPLGSLKMTTQKFYRISGGSNQYKGVIPNIILPDSFAYMDIGENKYDYAMPWDTIDKLAYEDWNMNMHDDFLNKKSHNRIDSDERFSMIKERTDVLKKRSENTLKSLEITSMISERKEFKEESDRIKEVLKENTDLEVVVSEYHEQAEDPDKEKKLEEWYSKIRKDTHIDEALSIINDIVEKK